IHQASPFLDLPGEIREQIYYAALVRCTPIDLWPIKFTKDEATGCIFRFQEDLEFVRKEMATGLIATCRQIYFEAGNMFWSKNTFRFSGNTYWFGARRFLGTIGPRALAQLKTLELFAPLLDFNSREHPWPWKITHRRRGSYRHAAYYPAWAEYKTDLRNNVEHVHWLLESAKTSLDLKLVVPDGFGLTLPAVHYWRPPSWLHDLEFHLSEEFLRTLLLFTQKFAVVLEAGAILESLEMVEQLTNNNIDVLCQVGSIFNYASSQAKSINKVSKLWRSPHAEFDYLVGIPELFKQQEGCEVPALGGRANKISGPSRTLRVLRGFGGCKFFDRDRWNCA
ncbi:hypothetical protein N431DRAFT_294106, partial [Stipitochalara longipes BDJ]